MHDTGMSWSMTFPLRTHLLNTSNGTIQSKNTVQHVETCHEVEDLFKI